MQLVLQLQISPHMQQVRQLLQQQLEQQPHLMTSTSHRTHQQKHAPLRSQLQVVLSQQPLRIAMATSSRMFLSMQLAAEPDTSDLAHQLLLAILIRTDRLNSTSSVLELSLLHSDLQPMARAMQLLVMTQMQLTAQRSLHTLQEQAQLTRRV